MYLLTRYYKESDQSRGELWTVRWAGGEARQLSHVSSEISEYSWSPDGRHLALAVRTTDAAKTPRPIVIDALQFKEDGSGYRHAGMHTAPWRLEVEKGDAEPLTWTDDRDDSALAISPDGLRFAYVSNRIADAGSSG